jgi:hypothetical protein
MSVILATWEAEIRRMAVQGQPRQNNQSKMVCRCDSSGRVLALLAQSPEFKPQSYQKKQTKQASLRVPKTTIESSDSQGELTKLSIQMY